MTIPYASVFFSNSTEERKNIQNILRKEVISRFSNVKMATAGFTPCEKKTKRTIPSLELQIVRLETNKTNPFCKGSNEETSNKLHKTERDAGTTPRGAKQPMPPPRKAFSDSKDFFRYANRYIWSSYEC